jgi:hypothetical protein
MPHHWPELLKRTRASARIDVAQYAAELDAIDDAVAKSVAAHDGKTSLSPWGWGDPIVNGSVIAGVDRRPIAPIRSADPGRVAVAILQRLYIERKAGFCGGDICSEVATIYVLLAMADRLLKRRLQLSPATGGDLARVINAPPLSSAHEQGFEYLFQALKQLERSFPPPVPDVVRGPLKKLQDGLTTSSIRPKKAWERGRALKVSKRYENACQRISQMLGDD